MTYIAWIVETRKIVSRGKWHPTLQIEWTRKSARALARECELRGIISEYRVRRYDLTPIVGRERP